MGIRNFVARYTRLSGGILERKLLIFQELFSEEETDGKKIEWNGSGIGLSFVAQDVRKWKILGKNGAGFR